MKIITQTWYHQTAPENLEIQIERAGRTCYKSDSVFIMETAERFIRRLIASGHESVLEHQSLTVTFVTDRGVSHELVRHRIASFSQESTRYCKYEGNVKFILPVWFENEHYNTALRSEAYTWWRHACLESEQTYLKLLSLGQEPQQARTVLNNSLATEIVVTANLREWRHILRLRTSKKAHPQMRSLMIPLLKSWKKFIPSVFEDIPIEENNDAKS